MKSKAAVAAAVLFMTAACGGPSQTPASGEDTFNAKATQIKIEALQTDPCYKDPEREGAFACEKYVTQIRNLANQVSTGATTGHPQLGGPARSLLADVVNYRKGGCNDPKAPSEQTCITALTDIATALDKAVKALAPS